MPLRYSFLRTASFLFDAKDLSAFDASALSAEVSLASTTLEPPQATLSSAAAAENVAASVRVSLPHSLLTNASLSVDVTALGNVPPSPPNPSNTSVYHATKCRPSLHAM